MKTSDKPEPYLAYVIEEGSELSDDIYLEKLAASTHYPPRWRGGRSRRASRIRGSNQPQDYARGMSMKVKSIGFTGTRNGMTAAQFDTLTRLLNAMLDGRPHKSVQFHHGDCIGADEQAASAAWGRNAFIVCHPPEDEKLRAFSPYIHETRERKSHLASNRDIVNECDVLIGTPPYQAIIAKETKGGTAYTVNYAVKMGKPALVVYPDGSVDGQIDLED
jgi:hypothetical protein